jgi:stearoyl-CoA desaturase (delta-9 desaturase)
MANILQTVARWFISAAPDTEGADSHSEQIDWVRVVPFIMIHVGCLFAILTGVSWVAFITALLLYWVRGISISAFYHRYFSHRTFKTGRISQFIFALFGASAMQKGPLWWAAYHRNHHRYADQIEDVHSPVVHGFMWSHMGWFLSKKYFSYDSTRVTDLARFPEIKLLDRFYFFVPLTLALTLFSVGVILQHAAPSLHTDGWQMLIWGFFISTTVLFHTTASVNSLAHKFGKRRYNTKDHSRNNWLLGWIAFGEGWHNNHHHYPSSVRLGFRWWEFDVTFYVLKALEKMGVIWDLRFPSAEIKNATDMGQLKIAEKHA